jgi:quercetin dioxygenase-like cupin family protein
MRFLLIAFLLAAAFAQTTPEVESTAEPHHHLVLENSYVRVFKVEIPPGDATLLHRHRHDYVYVTLGAAQISRQTAGEAPVTAKLQDGQTAFVEGGTAHVVRNLAATPFRNITVELMQDESARQSPASKWDVDRGLQILQGGTDEILFAKDGARVADVELQSGAMIPKHHHNGPHLIIAVTNLDLQNDVEGKGISKIQLKAGEVEWIPGGFTHSLMNVGKPAKYIALEFH